MDQTINGINVTEHTIAPVEDRRAKAKSEFRQWVGTLISHAKQTGDKATSAMHLFELGFDMHAVARMLK